MGNGGGGTAAAAAALFGPADAAADDEDEDDMEVVSEAEMATRLANEAWEREERTWEGLREVDGRLVGPDILERQRKERGRKYRASSSSSSAGARIRRGVIRYLYIAVDLSRATSATDLRPSRLLLLSAVVRRFIRVFFDENPLSHVGLLALRDMGVETLTELSGSPEVHIAALATAVRAGCSGEASLQNCLECALPGLVQGSPPYGCKELLILSSSLTTVDAGDIFKAVAECVKASVRVSVVGMAAEVRVCRWIANETGGTYTVATSEAHLEQLVLSHAQPPPQKQKQHKRKAGDHTAGDLGASSAGDDSIERGTRLVCMGFPERAGGTSLAYFEAESSVAAGGFNCPRCYSRVKDLPTTCPTCSLMLVSAPHLAKSYHHLFPVSVFREMPSSVDTTEADATGASNTAPRQSGTPLSNAQSRSQAASRMLGIGDTAGACEVETPCRGCGARIEGVRLQCPNCREIFCFDCDAFIHDRIFVCPGCV